MHSWKGKERSQEKAESPSSISLFKQAPGLLGCGPVTVPFSRSNLEPSQPPSSGDQGRLQEEKMRSLSIVESNVRAQPQPSDRREGQVSFTPC